MQKELIHHLIAFPAKWLEAMELYKKYNNEGDKDAYEKFKNDKEIYHAWQMAGRHRGSFTDKEQLINLIKTHGDPYSICECYYEYLLIETHALNCIDGILFSPDEYHEMWFRHVKIDEDTWEYQEIERPACLIGTCNFV